MSEYTLTFNEALEKLKSGRTVKNEFGKTFKLRLGQVVTSVDSLTSFSYSDLLSKYKVEKKEVNFGDLKVGDIFDFYNSIYNKNIRYVKVNNFNEDFSKSNIRFNALSIEDVSLKSFTLYREFFGNGVMVQIP